MTQFASLYFGANNVLHQLEEDHHPEEDKIPMDHHKGRLSDQVHLQAHQHKTHTEFHRDLQLVQAHLQDRCLSQVALLVQIVHQTPTVHHPEHQFLHQVGMHLLAMVLHK